MTNLKFRAYHHKMKKMLTVRCIDFHDKSFDCIDGDECFLVKFEDCEIMQSTGLTDKNGKEIFDGDILQVGLRIYEVIWEDGYYRLFDKKADSKEKYCSLNVKDTEIIGNIHENPELLNP